MARIGSNIQAGLGRIDYSPLFQGMSNAQQFAAQGNAALAQSIANIGQIAGSAIQGFQKKKEEEKQRAETIKFLQRSFNTNPQAFKFLANEKGEFDQEKANVGVSAVGAPGMMQYATFANEAEKQAKADKLKTDAAAYASLISSTGGERKGEVPFMDTLRQFQESRFSPEAKAMGRQLLLDQRKTEAEIGALEARASGMGGEPTSAMKNATVIADSELARGLITQDQYQGRVADIVAVGGVETFNPGGIFRRADGTGDPISTIVDARGNYYRHDAKGNRVKLNLSEYSPSSRSESNTLSPDGFRKISTDIVNQQNQINSINEFLKSTEGLSRSGLQRVVEGFTSKVKTALGLPLSEAENAIGEGKARQQRLLGAIRNEILGPGVLTDQDAERLYQAMDGDIRNISTNIDRVRKALFAIVNEKNNLYKQDLDLYNYNAKEKYTFARPLDLIPLYEFSNEQAPSLQQNNPFATTRTLRIGDGKLVPVKQPTQSQYNLLDFVGR